MFGDKLSFLIPHEWVEGNGEEDDHYLYHAPEAKSGWLRVSLITLRTVEPPSQRLKQIYGAKENVTVDAKTGNFVSVSEKDSQEDGCSIHIYYWRVANFVLPDLVHEAVFSYTILRERLNDQETLQSVKLIGQLVSEAEFSGSIANTV